MKINKNSWHFKLNMFFHTERYIEHKFNTLCSYFWATVFKLILFTSCLFMVCVVGYSTLQIIEFSTEILIINILLWLLTGGVVSIIFAIFIFTIFVFTPNLIKKYRYKHCNKPNLVLEYIKAKKEKFCPILTFVDSKKEEK